MQETWRAIESLGGSYEASDLGRVRRAGAPAPLKTSVSRGYERVFPHIAGVRMTRKVHALVLEAFAGQRPPGTVVNHRNGNKRDNRPENLEWCSYSGNNTHALRTGLNSAPPAMPGAGHPSSLLTWDAVKEIRSSSVGQGELAQKFGVSQTTISRVRSGDSWRTDEIGCSKCARAVRERDEARAEVAKLQSVISDVTKRLERIAEGRC